MDLDTLLDSTRMTIAQMFLSTNFETSSPIIDTKITLKTKSEATSNKCDYSLLYTLQPAIFELGGLYPQKTLITRSVISHVCATSTQIVVSAESQMSTVSLYWLFPSHRHFETSPPSDLKIHWPLQDRWYHIYVLVVFPGPKFHSILLCE